MPAAAEAAAAMRPVDEVRRLLTAVAAVLGETVSSFEHTVSRVTEIAVLRSGKADRDLVVALQEFDRLQQEFASLGEVLVRMGAGPDEAAETGLDRHVMAGITISDLKQRLARHLAIMTVEPLTGPEAEEAVF